MVWGNFAARVVPLLSLLLVACVENRPTTAPPVESALWVPDEFKDFPAHFSAPPVGTEFRWLIDGRAGTIKIEKVEGRLVTRQRGVNPRQIYSGFQGTTTLTNLELSFDRTKLDDFWPLAIGKSVSYESRSGSNLYTTHLKVTGYETVTTPAGAFKAFVIERNDGAVGPDPQRTGYVGAIFRYWWVPDIGYQVKYWSKTTFAYGPLISEGEVTEIVRPR